MSDSLGLSVNKNGGLLVVDNPVPQARYDFPYGDYIYYKSFINELSRVQEALINKGEVSILSEETDLSMNNPGDLLKLDLYLRDITSAKDGMQGLSGKGLKAQLDALAKL